MYLLNKLKTCLILYQANASGVQDSDTSMSFSQEKETETSALVQTKLHAFRTNELFIRIFYYFD